MILIVLKLLTSRYYPIEKEMFGSFIKKYNQIMHHFGATDKTYIELLFQIKDFRVHPIPLCRIYMYAKKMISPIDIIVSTNTTSNMYYIL